MDPEDQHGIRVGILARGFTFERWQADAIRHVMSVPGISLCLVIVDERSANTDKTAKRSTLSRPHELLYRQYRQRFFRPAAMATVDLSNELKNVPMIHCVPEVKGRHEHFSGRDIATISQHVPDVVLRFGFNILGGEILSLPKYGVWSFHHGDEAEFRGGPPGLWEIMKGSRTTGAILQRLTEKLDGGYILRKGWFPTIDHSLTETVDTVLSQTTIWPAQVMREILAGHHEAAAGEKPEKLGKLYTYPGNFAFIRFLWKLFRNKWRFHVRDLHEHDEWNIGVLHQPISVLLDNEASLNVRWLPAPAPHNFRADPFGYITADGSLNMLYEKFDHNTGRGEISRVRPRKDSVLKRSRTMLASEGHLSYPFVVQRNGVVHVIPESADKGRVELYKLNESNDGLELVGTLLNEPLYDPTVFDHEGRWWIFGTKAPLTNVALFAYYSDKFEGPYEPHLLNPIKLDIRSARPGGTPFLKDGILWRPAQDSSKTYGGRIAFNQIVELTPLRFKEVTMKFIGPLPGSSYDKGLHTVSAVGDSTLVDGKRFVTVDQRKSDVKKRKMEKLKRMRLS